MSKIAKATITLMLATVLAKILGFGRELVLANVYGASMYSDAYLTAMNIPAVIFVIVGTGITTTFIPMYFKVQGELGEEKALKFTNNTINIVVILCLTLSLLGIVFVKPLVNIFAIGFKGETLELAINFTKILILGTIFTGLSYVMTAYLQIKNNFTIPGLISLPKNIVIIVSMLLSIKYGPYVMVWGTLIGLSTEVLFQLPFAIKEKYKYKPYININDKYIKRMVWLLGPVLVGVAANQVNMMIDRTLASTLVEGSISALNYANKLNGFVMTLFIMTISQVIYPILSKLSTDDNIEEFRNSVVRCINSVAILVIPISVGAIVLANPIVKLLFERGAFDARATQMTASALIMYSVGMLAFGLVEILGKIFYSLQDTKSPMKAGIISVGINIVLNLILVKYLKHTGLALATSISTIICVFILLIGLKKRMGDFGQTEIASTMIKSIIASLVMGVGTSVSYMFISQRLGMESIGLIVSIMVSVIIGVIIYGVLVVLFKVKEIDIVISFVKQKINRKINI